MGRGGAGYFAASPITVALGETQANTTAGFLLSRFESLTNCTLNLPTEADAMSLSAFQALPQLNTLILEQGCFSDLHAAAHLTRLSLLHVYASCNEECPCVASLVKLRVVHSQLERLHPRGIAACCNLKQCVCNNGSISAADPMEDFAWDDTQGVQLGSTLSALTALTHLSVGVANSELDVSLELLTQLSALQYLWAKLSVR